MRSESESEGEGESEGEDCAFRDQVSLPWKSSLGLVAPQRVCHPLTSLSLSPSLSPSLVRQRDMVARQRGADLVVVERDRVALVGESLVIAGFRLGELVLVYQNRDRVARTGPEFLQFGVGGLPGEIEGGFGSRDAFPGRLDLACRFRDAQGDLFFEEFEVLLVVLPLELGGPRVAPALGKRQRNADDHAGGIPPVILVGDHAAARGERLVVSRVPKVSDEIELRKNLIAGINLPVAAGVEAEPRLLEIGTQSVAFLQILGEIQRQCWRLDFVDGEQRSLI